MVTDKSEVTKFLSDFKLIVSESKKLYVIPRQKNRDALVQLELTESIRRDVIQNLSTNDYCFGPEPDKERSGYLWVFGCTVDSKEIYIKLKIALVGTESIAKCLSFHEAAQPLFYPFRDAHDERSD